MEKRIKGAERILIIQFRPVGDILLTTPVAQYLKKLFPGIIIDFIVFENFYPILQYNPFIDRVIKIKKIPRKGMISFIRYIFNRGKDIKMVRDQRYDIVLDYIGSPTSAIMTFLSKARYKVGYSGLSLRSLLYNLKAVHDSEREYNLLKKYDNLKPLGIDIVEPVREARLFFSDEEKVFADKFFRSNNIEDRFTVLFSPDSPRNYKRWSFDNYCRLARSLIEKYNAVILLLYGPGEKEYTENMYSEIGAGSILLPETSILQAAALLTKVRLAVLNCGGIKHISVAVGTPSVTVFGKSSPSDWHPPGISWADYIEGSYVDGDNSFGISAGDVIEKIDDLIRKGAVNIK